MVQGLLRFCLGLILRWLKADWIRLGLGGVLVWFRVCSGLGEGWFGLERVGLGLGLVTVGLGRV